MDALRRVEEIIRPSLEAMGFDLVRLRISGAPPVLQIMAEKSSATDGITDGGITVEDCADISRALSAVLDVEDPISSAYSLEVSSPGIDRPLTRPHDYQRFRGHEAKIELKVPVEGRKRFKGPIIGIAGTTITVDQDGEAASFDFHDVATARLVLTEELIRASLAAAKQAGAALEQEQEQELAPAEGAEAAKPARRKRKKR